MLKDPLYSRQAGCFKGPICNDQRDEIGNRTEDRVIYFSKEEYSGLWASLSPLVVSQFDLYCKHIPLFGYRVPHDQEANIFIAKHIELSEFYFNVAHSNVFIRDIIIILGVQVSDSAIVVIIKAKVGISANFSIVETLVAYIISASFVIVKAGPSPLLLLCVDQLRRPTSRGEEKKQDQCKLYAMLLYREDRSIACPVVVE